MDALKSSEAYLNKLIECLNNINTTQHSSMYRASQTIADAVAEGGIVHTFGTGHSHILAEEAFYRAGGLVPVNLILDSGLLFGDGAVKSTFLERVEGYAEQIISRYQIASKDVLLLASNSGRNAVPIEMALCAKEKGIATIAITSVAHSSSISSRHKSGRKLMDIVDIVIDNGGVPGDAAISIQGGDSSVGPTSTVIGCALLNSIITGAVELLIERGLEPPIFKSSNLDKGDDYNQRQVALYRDRIRNL